MTSIAREDGARIKPAQARQLLAGDAQVLAIDPGQAGAAAIRLTRGVLFRSLDDWDAVARMVHWDRPLVVLLEDQWGGKSFASTKEVTWTSGVLAGYLFAQQPPSYMIVHLGGSTWQAAQRRRMAVFGAQLDRGEGLDLAMRELLDNYPGPAASVNKTQREGYASALGMLLWWEGLVKCKG
jgi:hypothetical protein